MIARFGSLFALTAITCACSPESDHEKKPIAAVDKVSLRQREGPPVELKVLASKPSDLDRVARIIHASGLQCDRVFRANELADEAGGVGIFKADCGGGQSYRVTFVDEQHSIEPWTNNLFGNSNAIHN